MSDIVEERAQSRANKFPIIGLTKQQIMANPVIMGIFNFFNAFGINLAIFVRAITFVPCYVRDVFKYKKLATGKKFELSWGKLHPILADASDNFGAYMHQYFWQDIYFARKIFKANPVRHVDIASRLDGFIAQLLIFRTVEIVDIRPLDDAIKGVTFICDDATKMEKFTDNSLESISSLNAVEHFGLGRYGDPIDPDAPFNFAKSLVRVVKPGGTIYFAVPCGKEAVYFNAHRVFDPQTVVDMFEGVEMVSFAAIMDDFKLHESCSFEELRAQKFGCGLFEFRKAA